MIDQDNIESSILDSLNEDQKNAVLDFNHNVRIIAGPGTGKTTTIIAKILYLIFVKKVNSKRILAITFTNKAKEEILQRIQKFTTDPHDLPIIFTYHSFASYFLRIELSKEEQKNFIIIDRTDQVRILKILKTSYPELESVDNYNFLAELNRYKIIDKDDLTSKQERQSFELFEHYENYKSKNNLFDFEDLLYRTNDLLSENSEIFDKWKDRFDYIFVDEFQDTNQVQFKILQKLVGNNTILTVVGDPDQNLYSWRGADINLILNFERYFNNSKTHLLSLNYRSTPKIVNLATKFIKLNQNRINNEIYTKNLDIENNDPIIYYFGSSQEEADFVAKEIKTLIQNPTIKPEDIAIIYRNNAISHDFESSMMNNNLQYKVIGGFKFYERKEIKETLSHLGVLFMKDNFFFETSSQVPSRGIGAKTLETIRNQALKLELNYLDTLKWLINEKMIKKESIINYSNLIEKYQTIILENKVSNISDFIKKFLEDLGFFKNYNSEEGRLENINQFIIDISASLDLKNLIDSFVDFSQKATLTSSSDIFSSENFLTLITSHSSKGTEFKVVFIVGLSEGVFPSAISKNNGMLEEERRSFYVAMTRAKEKLYFTFSNGRTYSGSYKYPSSFFKNLNIEIIDKKIDYNNKKRNLNLFNEENTKEANKVEDYFKDNSMITEGSVIDHIDYGIGTVIQDFGDYINVAFSHSIGIKKLIKNNKIIKFVK